MVKHYLSSSGFDTSDPRVLRLVSLAAQKFVSDVANDALQHCKMRNAGRHICLHFTHSGPENLKKKSRPKKLVKLNVSISRKNFFFDNFPLIVRILLSENGKYPKKIMKLIRFI